MLSRTSRGSGSHDDSSDSAAVQAYTDKQAEMQRSMMAELDRRRHDWEDEMHRMQQDFFKVLAFFIQG